MGIRICRASRNFEDHATYTGCFLVAVSEVSMWTFLYFEKRFELGRKWSELEAFLDS